MGPGEPSPIEQLRANLRRVMEFVMAERELVDILLNHSVGFDKNLDARIQEFYERVAAQIKRSLDLGIAMGLVRSCDTGVAARCILGGVKESVAQLSRGAGAEVGEVVEEVLNFGLRGVAQPELSGHLAAGV